MGCTIGSLHQPPGASLNEMKSAINLTKLKSFKDPKKSSLSLLHFTQTSLECCEQLTREGGIETLMILYGSKSSDAQDSSLRALIELSKSQSCREEILNQTAIKPFIAGLHNKQPDLRDLSLNSLEMFSDTNRGRIMLVNEGVVPG